MLRKVLLGALAALAAGMIMYQGCGSDGGGGDGQQALSFDSDTALPANGGAAIAVAFGSRLAATMPTIFQALVDETATASSEVQRKQLQFGLALCDDGTALIELDEIPPAEGSEATVTFEGCTGSPLSSTAVNGQLVLSNISVGPATDAFNPISADGRFAGLPGSVDFEVFTIAGEPNDTVLTGVVSVTGDFDPIVAAPETIVMTLAAQREDGGPVTISEGDRQLQLGCFDIDTTIDIGDKVCDEASDEAGDPCVADDDCTNGLCIDEESAITVFKPRGVLSLFFDVEKAGVYTLNSVAVPPSPPVPNIGFPPGSGIPNSGGLALHSGDQIGDGGCPAIKGGPFPGDGSTTTATFESEPEGRVTIEVQGSQCFECETTWENLLNTLSDIAFPDSCDKVECGGAGGTGGTAGTGGTSGAVEVLVPQCVASAYQVVFRAFLEPLDPILRFLDKPIADRDASQKPPIISLSELETVPDVYRRFTWDANDVPEVEDANNTLIQADFIESCAARDPDTKVCDEASDEAGDPCEANDDCTNGRCINECIDFWNLDNGIFNSQVVPVPWQMFVGELLVGEGQFSVVGLDNDTVRMTIVKFNPVYTNLCRFEIFNFNLHLDLATQGSEPFAVQIGYTADGSGYTIENGWITFGEGDTAGFTGDFKLGSADAIPFDFTLDYSTDAAGISGTFGGVPASCTIDLATFEVVC